MRGLLRALRREGVAYCVAASLLIVAAVLLVPAPAAAEIPVVRFEVERFEVEGENPLSEARTQEVLAPFTGEHAGVDGLLAAADALERAIEDAGVAFQRVMLPPQSLRDGVVTLKVAVFTVTRVEVRGAAHHSEANVRRSVPALAEGETPDTGAIARDLAVVNRQPWKSLTLTFRESETDATGLDAVLEVEDRRPRTFWSSLDNTGSAATGPLRWSLGASPREPLRSRPRTLNASYTTSPGHAGQVRQWALGYSAPLYGLGGTLAGYYVRSDIDTGRVLGMFDVSGAGAFAGLLYTHELERQGRWSHRLSAGVDDRHFDTDVVFAGVDVASAVRSRPASLHYAAEYAGEGWGFDMRLQYARNLERGGGNNDPAYARSRAGAVEDWDLLRGNASVSMSLPAGWTARGVLEGQYAGEALIPGEQFGLGGASSVRGFSEREIAGDNGVRGSLELWSPAVMQDSLRLLLFADAGRVRFEGSLPAPDAERDDALVSVGGGLRWNWREHVALLLDAGAVVEGTAARESGVRGHMNLLVSY